MCHCTHCASGVDVAQVLAPAEVAQRRDEVHAGVGVVDGHAIGERLVVVAAVDDDGARPVDAGPRAGRPRG